MVLLRHPQVDGLGVLCCIVAFTPLGPTKPDLYLAGLAPMTPSSRRYQSDKQRNYTHLAAFNGNDDITTMHIDALLKKHRIDGFVESTGGAGLWVANKGASRAIKLFMEDAKRRRYHIVFLLPPSTPGERNPRIVTQAAPPQRAWKKQRLNRKYGTLVRHPATPTILAAVLRQAEIQAAARKYPYVATVASLRRTFLSDGGREQVGYEVVVGMKASVRGKSERLHLHFQVWNQGQAVSYQGGMLSYDE